MYIYIDNKLAGKTEIKPLVISKVSVGKHTLRVEKTGYKSAIGEFKVRFKKIINLKSKLIELTGLLNIESEPTGAVVFIDGKEQGNTPLFDKKVNVGEHRVSMQLKGYNAHQETIKTSANKAHRLVAALKKVKIKPQIAKKEEPDINKILKNPKSLEKKQKSEKKIKRASGSKPWYKSSWLWVAAGAVVTGSAAVYLFANDDTEGAEGATGGFTIEFPEPSK